MSQRVKSCFDWPKICPAECNWFKKLAWNFLKAKWAQPVHSHKDQKLRPTWQQSMTRSRVHSWLSTAVCGPAGQGGHWQDLVITEDVMECQYQLLLQIAKFYCFPIRLTTKWRCVVGNIINSVKGVWRWQLLFLLVLWLSCSNCAVLPGCKFHCLHCPWTSARMCSAVSWRSPLLCFKQPETGSFVLQASPAESEETGVLVT